MPFLRIAPICNGKIYVAPRSYQGEEPGKLDVYKRQAYECKGKMCGCRFHICQ